MTITALAQPANWPPRNQITITSPDGSPFTAVSLTATANGVTTLTRVQPAPGPSPLIVWDYESARETGVVYTATVTHGAMTETYVSAPVTLTPPLPWLTHPTTPALSMPLDQNTFSAMGVVSIGSETRAALTTKHRILGAEYEIVTKTGPRAAPSLQMVLTTTTPQEREALIALLRDQTPILITVPSAWGWDWDDGYYDVGDVGWERLWQYGADPRRTVTLPLERVQAPAGTQQAVRSWATLLHDFATWADVAAAYATWTDVLTDTRR
jgi:hypothetical protein